MDKEDVVRIDNGILLSHEEERSEVPCRDMGGSRHLTEYESLSWRSPGQDLTPGTLGTGVVGFEVTFPICRACYS